MSVPNRVLIFHTSFIGDVILALPMAQALRAHFPQSYISMVTIPSVSNILENHQAINERIVYDKRGMEAGLKGITKLAGQLRERNFDVAIVPHRSLRSAVVARLAGIPRRIGFTKSSGSFLFTELVRYDEQSHEIHRNLSLLEPLGIFSSALDLPTLYPSAGDKKIVDGFLEQRRNNDTLVAVAPGSVWFTKRWLKERFVELVQLLSQAGFSVALIGGKNDVPLCQEIADNAGVKGILNAAGKLTLLQSAELIRRCRSIVSNDSAPMHLAVAMRTPVVAIFGATVPEFGFAPLGEHDEVIQTHGLVCRPCAIHGGNKCPIRTFECMKNITADHVFERVKAITEILNSKL